MLNILVVEDDEQTLRFCANTIRNLGSNINPIPVTTAEIALEKLENNNIDGAFIDIILPGMDGFSLANRIREMDNYYFLPIVFITGENKDIPDTYKEYRIIDYVLKPFTIDVFRSALLRLIKEIEKQRALPTKKEARKILFLHDQGQTLIKFSEVLYASTVPNRKIKLVTIKDEYIKSNFSLINIMTEINEEAFVQCHKAYAVNTDNIIKIEIFSRKAWTIYFKDALDVVCPMSRNYRKTVEDNIKKTVFNEGNP